MISNMIYERKQGFSIIELLIAVTILSIALLGIISGVTTSIMAISGNENKTKAMIISKNLLNEFLLDKMRGLDINDEPVEDYPGFTYNRTIERFEHEILGPLNANRVEFMVNWEERGRKKHYKLSYIYPMK